MKWLGWIVLSIGLVATGCGNGTDDPEDTGTDQGSQDVTADDGGPTLDEGGTDTNGQTTGQFDDPCTEDAECESGFCVAVGDGFACTQLCDGTCPDGWNCRDFVFAGNVSVSVCVHEGANLCRPCNGNSDCADWGGTTDDRCVVFGDYEGSFCGTACGTNADCSPGYSCSAVQTAGGGSSDQCVPDINECGCNAHAVDLKASTDCGTGVCIGSRTCNEDGLTDCSAQFSTDEICDGEDNDCNGVVDDDGLGATLCGVGACQVEQTNCIDGLEQICTADEPTDEVCDGIDNDCDGTADEELGSSSCGVGECVASVENCVEAVEQTCVPGEPTGEICDGLDNDCDGTPDEDLGSTSCGVGECAVSIDNCVGGAEQTCVPGTASVEVCDGLDNDCDSTTDEDLGSTSCGVGECVASVQNCVGGAEQTCVPGATSAEACDGLDNDCDGTPDEDLGSTTCGVGECAASVQNCVGGAEQTCVPGVGSAEICDGLDNNCDGETDEAFNLQDDPGNCGACGVVCPSGVCGAGACQSAACDDGVLNGEETDVDCGGLCLTTCADGLQCLSGVDCQSGICEAGACSVPSCTDGLLNGDELYTDCGGSCPGPTPGLTQLIPGGEGTPVGNLTATNYQAGIETAFNQDENPTHVFATEGAGSDGSINPGYLGKDWGSGNSKVISGVQAWTPLDTNGFFMSGGGTVTLTLQGSDDNFVTTVDLGSSTISNAPQTHYSKTSGYITTTGYRYHRLKIEYSVAAGSRCDVSELQFFEVTEVCGVPAPSAAGDIVITEIMKNPFTRPDGDGEWFEIYNPSPDTSYDLANCAVSDLGSDGFLISELAIGPGEHRTLAVSSIPGFTADYNYDGQMTLANGDDEILIHCGGVLIDQVDYTDAAFPDSTGSSMSLNDASDDNSLAASWCDGVAVFATTADGVSGFDYGSPGSVNPLCP